MQLSGKFPGVSSRSYAALLTVLSFLVAVCGLSLPASAQTQMGAASQLTQMGALPNGGALGGGSPAGNSMGVNSLGNVIAGTSYGNSIAQFTPAGVVTTLGTFTYVGPVIVDSANNIYAGVLYNNLIVKIPYVSGTYAPITTPTYSMASCTGADTMECTVPNPLAGTAYSVNGYASMAFDKAGDLFFSSTNSGTTPNAIFECSVACLKNASTTPAVLVYQEPTSTTAQLYVGGLAVDASGNVFFTDSVTNGTLDSTASNLKEALALTATTFAAPTTLYTLTPAAPGNYDNQIDGVAVDANNVYFATVNDGIFAMPNTKGVVNKAGLFTVSNAGAKIMTTDGAGNFYIANYVNTGDAVERVSVGTVSAPSTAVGSFSAAPNVTVFLSDGTCTGTPPAAATFTSSNAEFSTTLGKICSANSLTGTATFSATVAFTPAGSGTRMATETGKDQLTNTLTFTATGTGTGGSAVTVATPTFSPAGGTYTATQTVALSDATAGSTIYYTTNGSMPTTASIAYTGPITVATTETIMAIGVATGDTNSTVASATYTINQPTAATPTFSPAGGTYASAQTVTLADTTTGAMIYYTTNGAMPTTASIAYTGPITVSSTETIMAIAVASGYGNSAVASAAYTINLPAAATPTFTPAGGTYTSAQTVTLADTTAGAKIYYTLDGSAPTTSSTPYTAPISVGSSETINALATAPNYTASATGTAAYTINLPAAAAPAFSVAGGTYNSNQTVTLSDTTAGAAIYYTTNGSTPTTSSMLYTGAITVSSSETIMALATATNYSSSAVSAATYTLVAAAPTFTPAGGTYTSVQSVTIADATAGAKIFYTTDGSMPTTSSTLYTGPVSVGTSETLTAVATFTGYSNSAATNAAYTINLPAAASPTFTPGAGTYTAAQTVTIADATTGAAIYYTINGSVPTTSSTLYTGPISVATSETIMAIATASGSSTSAVASAAYVINLPVSVAAATPAISPASGSYATAQTVTITDSTPGAVIYYTTNGSVPTANSTVYTTAITVSVSETVSAIAVAPGFLTSATATAMYTIGTVTPSFSISVTPGALTVMDGSTGTVALNVIPTNGFSSAIALSCSGLPLGATCTFAPATLTPSGTGPMTDTVTISTAALTSSTRPETRLPLPGSILGGATAAAALCMIGFRRRRKMQALLLLLIGLAGLGMMTGCGSSSTPNHTPVVTVITITATSGNFSPAVPVTLTVN